MDFFYSLGHPNTDMNLERWLDDFIEYRRGGFVPVASAGSGSFVVIDTRDPEHPIVYVDVADPLDEQGLKRTWPLAATIEELCERLTDD